MEMNKLIKEEILRYQELMGYPSSDMLNESAISRVAGNLKRFAKGALKTALDQSIALEVKNGINKALNPKRLSQAFLSELVAGKRTIDQLVSKVNPKEVVDKIALGLKKKNITLTKLEKVSLRQEVEQSIKNSLKKPSTDVGFKIYYRSFFPSEKEYFKEAKRFKEAKLGRKLNDKELLALAKKSKGKKLKKPKIDDGRPKIDDGGRPKIDDGGRPKIDDGGGSTPIIDGGGRFKKYRRKVKTAWQKIKIRWNSLSRSQRRFWRVAGAVLGVGLAAWLYFVLSKEGYCKCLINMLQDSDADYMDSVSMEDAMFLGQTFNNEIDAQGGGIFYLDGKFKTKNGKLQGRYTCNNSGIFVTANGTEYKLECKYGIDDDLPVPVIEDDDEDNNNTNTGNTETIIFKDCEGPEYQLGCTDKGDTIERVQACLRVPVTGKFDKDLEMALLKKLGKKTFTEQDVFIICDINSTTNFTFG
jgi:hypothetical protein